MTSAMPPISSIVSGELECDAAAGATRGRTRLAARFVDRERVGAFFAAAGF